jgi:nucleotidyltransferase/DNA polymerase involved in DNA repair
MKERAGQMKEEVTRLFGSIRTVVDKMNLVDAIQRLGIDHLFQDQIIAALRDIHGAEFNSFSLHDVALRFRLLRQDGFWVSSGMK